MERAGVPGPFLKPDTCRGCPFYEKSKYFTPDFLNPSSDILVLAQNAGEHEERGKKIEDVVWSSGKKVELCSDVVPQPLIGPTGRWIQQEFWPLTKQGNWYAVSKANVIKCRPYGKNDLPPLQSKELRQAIDHCTNHHLRVPDRTRIVLALGQIALYALTGEKSITEWRGYVIGSEGIGQPHYGLAEYYDPLEVKRYNIFCTVHPASLFKQTTLDYAVRRDFVKFGRFMRGEWPKRLPGIRTDMPTTIPSVIGFDTEYDPHDNDRLIMWSMADLDRTIHVVSAFASHFIHGITPQTRVFTQNGLVDLPHLRGVMDVSRIILEDTMLMDSVLWTGRPHDLNHLCSLYGSYNRHKHLREVPGKEELYAGLDADTTLNDVGRALIEQMKEDPLSWRVYTEYRRPLLSIIEKAQVLGIGIDQERALYVQGLLEGEKERLLNEARLITGKEKFNLGSSKQVGGEIYEGDDGIYWENQ